MALHRTLTDPEIHEPKGAASANEGQVYVANGSGSGVWTLLPQGWGFYKNDGAAQTITSTPTKLTVNGLEGTTNTAYLPLAIRGTGQLWDTTSSKVLPIAVGDSLMIRVDLPITARATAKYINVILDLGGGATPTLPVITTRVEVDQTAPFSQTIQLDSFAGTNFLANGGQIFINTDTDTIEVTNPSVKVTRTSGEIV